MDDFYRLVDVRHLLYAQKLKTFAKLNDSIGAGTDVGCAAEADIQNSPGWGIRRMLHSRKKRFKSRDGNDKSWC